MVLPGQGCCPYLPGQGANKAWPGLQGERRRAANPRVSEGISNEGHGLSNVVTRLGPAGTFRNFYLPKGKKPQVDLKSTIAEKLFGLISTVFFLPQIPVNI